MEIKSFYYINCANPYFNVRIGDFTCGPAGLLWCFMGRYGLIPVEVVKNALMCAATLTAILRFYWDETVPVPPEVAKLLLSEQNPNERGNNSSDDSEATIE